MHLYLLLALLVSLFGFSATQDMLCMFTTRFFYLVLNVIGTVPIASVYFGRDSGGQQQ